MPFLVLYFAHCAVHVYIFEDVFLHMIVIELMRFRSASPYYYVKPRDIVFQSRARVSS